MGSCFSKLDVRLKGKKVIIVGGSLAGIKVAGLLEQYGFEVTIIEPRDFLFVPFGAMRAATSADESWSKRLTVPLDRALKSGVILRGKAQSVDPEAKTVQFQSMNPDGSNKAEPAQSLAYDFLVIACGAQFESPFKPASVNARETQKALVDMGVSVRAAKKVVIVGGGPCGIEMAGEVRDANPAADITLVHSGTALLTGSGNQVSNPKLSEKLIQRLNVCKITTLLNTRVVDVVGGSAHAGMGSSVTIGPCECKLSGGHANPTNSSEATKLTAEALSDVDLVINAKGSGKPNTQWLAGSPLATALDKNGAVKCSRTYAVQGFESTVFTFGDCAAGPDAKAGWLLDSAAAVVCENIRLLALSTPGASQPKLKQAPAEGYKGLIVVPIGKSDGAGLLPFGTVGPWFTSIVKGGDLFLEAVSGSVGYSKAELVARN